MAFPNNEARQVAALAVLAEDCGWDGCFLGDFIWGEDPMIALAAAAMVTSRIRLGTMVIPVPIRRPWKIANESLALDRLSGGRLILGLGTGATWMGWQSFLDEVTGTKARIEMLEDSADLSVGECDAGGVMLAHLVGEFAIRIRVAIPAVVLHELARTVPSGLADGFCGMIDRWKTDIAIRFEVPRRRTKREVWTNDTNSEKERLCGSLIVQIVELPKCLVGNQPVWIA